MDKKQAWVLITQLLDASVKSGIFKTAAEVITLQTAVNTLKPDDKP
jgi:hypothetical protein